MSHAMIGRIWRTFGLQPHITRSFKLSPDPQLVDKVRDVVGLYMNPPNNAVVFSFDEKSQIQALPRAPPILPMDIGQPERRTHAYLRHGTLDLFAALNVATGAVLARCKQQHRALDFVAFLRDIDASVEAGGASLVTSAPTLPFSFHAHVPVVAEHGRAILRTPHREGTPARISSQHPATPDGDPRVCRCPQREPPALSMDQDRR